MLEYFNFHSNVSIYITPLSHRLYSIEYNQTPDKSVLNVSNLC